MDGVGFFTDTAPDLFPPGQRLYSRRALRKGPSRLRHEATGKLQKIRAGKLGLSCESGPMVIRVGFWDILGLVLLK